MEKSPYQCPDQETSQMTGKVNVIYDKYWDEINESNKSK